MRVRGEHDVRVIAQTRRDDVNRDALRVVDVVPTEKESDVYVGLLVVEAAWSSRLQRWASTAESVGRLDVESPFRGSAGRAASADEFTGRRAGASGEKPRPAVRGHHHPRLCCPLCASHRPAVCASGTGNMQGPGRETTSPGELAAGLSAPPPRPHLSVSAACVSDQPQPFKLHLSPFGGEMSRRCQGRSGSRSTPKILVL